MIDGAKEEDTSFRKRFVGRTPPLLPPEVEDAATAFLFRSFNMEPKSIFR